MHKLQMLRGTRTTSLAGRNRGVDEAGRFLVVVSRHEGDLFSRISEQLLDDPRVRVILDRRHLERRQDSRMYWRERRLIQRRQQPDYWEDMRYHPVIVVSTRKSSESRESEFASEPELAPEPSIPEVETMEPDSLTDVRRRIEDWTRDGQDILNKVLPQIFEQHDDSRQRAEMAEGRSAQLAAEVERLHGEMARLQDEVERLRRDGAEMAETVQRALTDIGRLATDMLAKVATSR